MVSNDSITIPSCPSASNNYLGTREDNLARDKNEQDDLGLDHTVDETREQLRNPLSYSSVHSQDGATHLWLVTAELPVAVRKTLQTDRELDVTTADNVLDLELRELGIEAKLLDDPGVLARRKPRVVLALRTGDDHLAGCEDEGGRLRVTNTHDDRGETL